MTFSSSTWSMSGVTRHLNHNGWNWCTKMRLHSLEGSAPSRDVPSSSLCKRCSTKSVVKTSPKPESITTFRNEYFKKFKCRQMLWGWPAAYFDWSIGGTTDESVAVQMQTPHRVRVTNQRLHWPLTVRADIPNLSEQVLQQVHTKEQFIEAWIQPSNFYCFVVTSADYSSLIKTQAGDP